MLFLPTGTQWPALPKRRTGFNVCARCSVSVCTGDLGLQYQSKSAYRPNHSTETTLVHTLDTLLLASDAGKISLLTLLDLSAAFDIIDHSVLLSRLQNTFGINGTALTWFASYLTDRFQKVIVNKIQSKPVKMECGVPQGSVQGPVLFILYTAPLSHIINNYHIDHHFYADNTQLQCSDTVENLPSLLINVPYCLQDIKNWITQNKSQLNADKTEAMLIGTQQKLSSIAKTSI